MSTLLTSSENKIVTQPEQLASRVRILPRPLVFTNGCFDILHRGHIDYLEQARTLGQSLVVGVNSDASVRSLSKGADRPINTLEDRMAILAALECVSLVVAFDDRTPLALIKSVAPDYLVKGGDWRPEQIVGAKQVQAAGGTVRSIAIRYPHSTTDLLHRIRSNV